MIKIGLIDDDKDQRESLAIGMELQFEDIGLEGKIEVIHIPPFEKKEDYVSWIQEYEISALILDEKLKTVPNEKGICVDYLGHELGRFLRVFFKDMPMYVITAFDVTEELKNSYKLFNYIWNRKRFFEEKKEICNLIYNNSKKFFKEYHEQLAELSALSKKIALGKASQEDFNKAKGIQQLLELPMSVEYINDRQFWIEEASESLEDLRKTIAEVEDFLKNNN